MLPCYTENIGKLLVPNVKCLQRTIDDRIAVVYQGLFDENNKKAAGGIFYGKLEKIVILHLVRSWLLLSYCLPYEILDSLFCHSVISFASAE